MAILKQPKNYRTGDAVSASVINDTIHTAIESINNSTIALVNSNNALACSTVAEINSNNTVTLANNAHTKAQAAIDNSSLALSTVKEIKEMMDSGKLNGTNAAVVNASGIYTFKIMDNNLMLYYSDGEKPNFTLNNNGELIYNFFHRISSL